MIASKKLIFILLMVTLASFLSACSHVAYPRGPIPVKMDVVGRLDIQKEISFENGVTDAKLTLVAVQGAYKWFANYKEWTNFIITQLENELRNRGVPVRPESENIYKLKVESVGLFWGTWATRCIVNVRVERKDGTWSKTYEGNNPSPASLYRAIDGAVYRAVVAILEDKDFRNSISR